MLAGHSFGRNEVTLENWRTHPYSAWSFQNVSEIVPSAKIDGNGLTETGVKPLGSFADLLVRNASSDTVRLESFLRESNTDSLVVMRGGDIIAEWYAPTCDPLMPHLLFSVSKSITGILAGILEDKGALSSDHPVVRHVPESKGSAYGDATLRHLLDMQVALDFSEDYLDPSGSFGRYRCATGWNPLNLGEPSTDLKTFLCSIQKSNGEHGKAHLYCSPNTDMLGIVLERAAGKRIPDLISELLWKPLGAHSDAFVTVDRIGTSRVAGGISCTARDLARFGEMVRLGGEGIVSKRWIEDLWTGGNREIWQAADTLEKFVGGSCRSHWYETGQDELAAIGIHGQLIWIDPATQTVVIKQSCHELPTSEQLDLAVIAMMRAVAKA
jgi:CubicO group peptidase (beta-lactamase class C family)